MRKTSILSAVAGLGATIVFASSASATVIYGDYLGAGNAPDFLGVQETTNSFVGDPANNIPDPEPLFGAPIRVGNALLFFPSQYSSSSAGSSPGADTTSGTIQLTIKAKPGFFLDDLTIREFGDWSLTGVGTAATSARASGSLFVTDLMNGNVYSDLMTVTSTTGPETNPFELPNETNGNWEGVVNINLSGLGISMIQLTFNNILQTSSEDGTTAFIQKKIVNGPAVSIEIPAPAGVSALALAGLVAARRRRA